MEEREYIIALYEYYGKLLTLKQQSYFEDYYYDNLTMEEIAINDSVSKNAVSKQLISIKDKLISLEEILNLYSNRIKINKILKETDFNKISEYI
ncbi:MAG: transcriptional regulator [Bacilli bacterium]|nr:transcriptional regulator [Bacilli bacterium]